MKGFVNSQTQSKPARPNGGQRSAGATPSDNARISQVLLAVSECFSYWPKSIPCSAPAFYLRFFESCGGDPSLLA